MTDKPKENQHNPGEMQAPTCQTTDTVSQWNQLWAADLQISWCEEKVTPAFQNYCWLRLLLFAGTVAVHDQVNVVYPMQQNTSHCCIF